MVAWRRTTPSRSARAPTPTPRGIYYIVELLQPPDPGGTYGPFSFGLSAHSNVLQTFSGGDGRVGLHGTNEPGLIGSSVSHGCIRIRNEAVRRLARILPLGTPVFIRSWRSLDFSVVKVYSAGLAGEGPILEQQLSRRRFLAAAGAGAASLAFPKLARGLDLGGSVVLHWNDALLQGVRNSKLGPPMVARALAIAHTCIYDAWAAYDNKAVGTRLGSSLRVPSRERTLANRKQAISFAAYHAAVDLFPGSASSVFDPLMLGLGYDAGDRSTDTSTPAGVGNVAAQAVLDFRHRDGANQLGDELGGTASVSYSDYTGYAPVNEPLDIRLPFDPTTVHDPNAWQPLRYVDAGGAVVTPGFVGAQWQHVTTFALSPGSLRSSAGPARFGSPEYLAQAQALLDISAGLTDEQKMIAEYWADGPHSELPPGHWNLFAQFVSGRDRRGDHEHRLERDVKLFFVLTNAVSDAGCCAWDNKRAFNSVRPITAIRTLFRGRAVRAWGGPYQGTRLIDGAAWFPYQPTTFPTPPFPEYSSGHSNFSGAGAEILRRFTRSDRFGASVRVPAGSSRVEPGVVPSKDVTLAWSTFSEAADQAGISRRYGGIHFEQGDLDARITGRMAAQLAWERAQDYWDGR